MYKFKYKLNDIYHDLLAIQRKCVEELSLINSAYEEEYKVDYPDEEILWHLGIRSLDYSDFLHQIDLILEKIHYADEV